MILLELLSISWVESWKTNILSDLFICEFYSFVEEADSGWKSWKWARTNGCTPWRCGVRWRRGEKQVGAGISFFFQRKKDVVDHISHFTIKLSRDSEVLTNRSTKLSLDTSPKASLPQVTASFPFCNLSSTSIFFFFHRYCLLKAY